MTTPTRKPYIAIINGEESHPIEGILAKDANEARKKARWHMTNVVGWLKQDGKLSIKVRRVAEE